MQICHCPVRYVAAALLAIGACLPDTAEATRRAVIVGIDKYAPIAAVATQPTADSVDGPSVAEVGRSGWYDLDGAVNDALAMRDILVLHGFETDNVTLLLDAGATREAILGAIQSQLIDSSRKGDVAFFFFAGHGSQVGNSSEIDGLDETIVPADANRGAWDIRDKELRRLFGDILDRGAYLTAVIDACHSGGIARGFQSGKVRALARDPRDIARFVGKESTDDRPPPGERGALILSASQSHQLAMESRDAAGSSHGLFSLSLLRALRTASADESAERLLLRTKGYIRAEGKLQEPSADALPDRLRQPFFGAAASTPPGPLVVPVIAVLPDGSVEIGAGVALRLGPGSELVRRDGGIVRVRISKNESLSRSIAHVIQGDAEDLSSGSLLEVDRWVPPAGAQLRVWIPPSMELGELEASLRQLDRLAAAKDLVWIVDPTEEQGLLNVLVWSGTTWTLRTPDGVESKLGTRLTSDALSKRLFRDVSGPPRLFVLVPPTAELLEKLRFISDAASAIDSSVDIDSAHYMLVGRGTSEFEYAFLLPEAIGTDAVDSALPVRTRWVKGDDAEQLDVLVQRLARLRAWLTLEPPIGVGTEYPYRLALRSSDRLVDDPDSTVYDGEEYELVLRAPEQILDAAPMKKHYVYVFAFDAAGNRALLFPGPQAGVGENYLPVGVSAGWPEEISLRTHITVAPPYGRDTYFLLVTREPLPNPGVLREEGVARGGAGDSSLGNLIRSINTTRGVQVVTPVNWSVSRLALRAGPSAQKD